jgi:predicted metalloprotease
MAVWDNLGSGNVEDRRGMGGLALGGGGAVVGIVLFLVMSFLGVEVDPALLEQIASPSGTPQTTEQPAEFRGKDTYESFASSVLGSNNAYWENTYANSDIAYTEPRLVLFRDATQSGCGIATSQVGPHYCPSDSTIYLDETFFDVLAQLGGTNEDVAQAYVISHEVGHHVQNINGTMSRTTNNPEYQRTGENSLSVKLELQADCYAGLWAHSLKGKGVFDNGEINEAIRAAEAVGDDRVQRQTGGSINPETWTHGSSEDRVKAFNKGYESGDLQVCNAYI